MGISTSSVSFTNPVSNNYQRPATVIGFASPSAKASTPTSTPTESKPNSVTILNFNPNQQTYGSGGDITNRNHQPESLKETKIIYIPVSILTALERLQIFINSHSNLRCEVKEDKTNGKFFIFLNF